MGVRQRRAIMAKELGLVIHIEALSQRGMTTNIAVNVKTI